MLKLKDYLYLLFVTFVVGLLERKICATPKKNIGTLSTFEM